MREHEACGAVVNGASWGGDGAGGGILRRRDGDDAVAVDGDDGARAGVEGGGSGTIVGGPPRA